MHNIKFSLLFAVLLLFHQAVVAEKAFVNVTVIPMTGKTSLDNQSVVVKGDRIVAVGPVTEVKIPSGTRVIDGTDKYLIPGFAEMHGHLPGADDPPEYTRDVLFLFLANGVTTVRGMQGAPGQLELRERIRNGEITGPTLYLAGPALSGKTVTTREEAIRMVREQNAAGWDSLKIHEGIPPAAYEAITKTAHSLGMRFGGHVPNDVGIFTALARGQHTIDHMDNYLDDMDAIYAPVTAQQIERAVNATLAAGTAVVPTLALWKIIYNQVDHDIVLNYPELSYMPQRVLDRWIERLQQMGDGVTIRRKGDSAVRVANRDVLLKAFSDTGVPVLFGTDAPQIFSVPGFSIHREIEAMKNAGMSDYAILHSGTAAVGNYYSDTDFFGKIEEGARADLLLLDSNPLADVRHIRDLAGVMVRGNWLDKKTIDSRLGTIHSAHSN